MKQESTIEKQEIDHFSSLSEGWWDELSGPFAILHRLGPVRMRYIRDQIFTHFKCSSTDLTPFKGLKVLDIGCGGGLMCEPVKRLGANVTGIDADETAIKVASDHAKVQNLDIIYKATTSDEMTKTTEKFDVVLALEIIEHVADPEGFIHHCSALCKPDGLVIVSTLNKNIKSFLLGIVAAERILGWVPKNTHSWNKFIKPSTLARHSRNASMTPADITGLMYDIRKREFRLSKSDIDVNYFMTLKKGKS